MQVPILHLQKLIMSPQQQEVVTMPTTPLTTRNTGRRSSAGQSSKYSEPTANNKNNFD